MGQINLQTRTRAAFGKVMVITEKEQYSTIPSELLVRRVAQTANVKESTIKSGLLGLKEAVRYFVINGHSVNLGAIGFLKMGISAQSCASAKQVNADLIRKATINYTPSIEVKNALATISFNSK